MRFKGICRDEMLLIRGNYNLFTTSFFREKYVKECEILNSLSGIFFGGGGGGVV